MAPPQNTTKLRQNEEAQLITTRYRFFSPFELTRQQREKENTKNCCQNTARHFAQNALSASAAYLVFNPSIKYAESNLFDLMTIPPSTIATGFLINWYAINYLWDELEHAKGYMRLLIISMILGLLTALPSLFIQLIESAADSPESAWLSAIIVFIGTTPMQVLGFFDFAHEWMEYIQYLYHRYLSKNEASKLIVKNYFIKQNFLAQLEYGLTQAMNDRELLNSYLTMEDQQFLTAVMNLVRNSETENSSSKLNVTLGIIVGLGGLALAESTNFSFSAATYQFLSHKTSYLSAIITTLVAFPMFVLAADFGFNATRQLYSAITNFAYELKNLLQRKIERIGLPLPYSLNPKGGCAMLIGCCLIASRSYAGYVQFNIDIFGNHLSADEMKTLNRATLMGGLIFNTFIVKNIGEKTLCILLKKYGSIEEKNKADFYLYTNTILGRYRRLPPAVIVDNSTSFLEQNPADHLVSSPSIDVVVPDRPIHFNP